MEQTMRRWCRLRRQRHLWGLWSGSERRGAGFVVTNRSGDAQTPGPRAFRCGEDKDSVGDAKLEKAVLIVNIAEEPVVPSDVS
jgi:hypothetical protein